MPASDFIEDPEGPEGKPTPTLAQTILEAIKAQMVDLRVSVPAKVLNYDHKKQLASVQPLFRRTYPDGERPDPPKIFNVPLAHPGMGDSFIHFPVKPGDTVQLVIHDTSNDKWIENDGIVDPEDARAHDLSDSWAYPGGRSKKGAFSPANNDDVIIKNKKGEIRVKNNGKFQMLGSGDLISAIHALAQATLAVANAVDGQHGSGTSGQVTAAMNKIGKFKA